MGKATDILHRMAKHRRRVLSMPDAWWEAVKRAADASGQTLTGWIREAIRKALPPEVRKKLPPANKPGGHPDD